VCGLNRAQVDDERMFFWFALKTKVDSFSWFGFKTGGFRFFGLGLKIGRYGLVIWE
jgi:hypothetical protein